MLKISVSDQATSDNLNAPHFEIKKEEDLWLIDGKPFDGDIAKIRENHWHIIWNNRSYNVELVNADHAEKTLQLLINGRTYHTHSQDRLALLLQGMGMQATTAQKLNHVKAPMPGLIQSVSVAEGDTIEKGDNLLVLVAMKMENVIKSPGSGTIKSLKIVPGQIVEKNQVLLEIQ